MKKWIVILVCIILGLIGYNIYIKREFSKEQAKWDTYITNDSIRTINDTIIIQRDSIINKRIYLEKEYETETININNQSISSDIKFCSDYLSKFNERFVNNNDSSTTKNN